MSSPITCKAPPQQGQLLSSTSTRTSTRGRCAGKAPRLRRRTRGGRGVLLLAAASCCRLGCCRGLLEVLQAELQLVGVEPLRAAAELAALQLPDQQPQLLDLGLRRVTLRHQDGIRSARTVSRSACNDAYPGAFCWAMTSAICRNCCSSRSGSRGRSSSASDMAAILLADSRGSQDFRSPSRARARDRAGLQPVPRQALEQGRELRRAQAHHAFRRRGPAEPPGLQPLRCTGTGRCRRRPGSSPGRRAWGGR